MDQGEPPSQPRTGRNHPGTSMAAAEIIAPTVDTLRERVLYWAEQQPHGFIHEELSLAFPHYKPNSVFPRCTELAEQGKVLDTGFRRTNRAGNSCVVWIATSLTGREPRPLEKRPTFAMLNARIETLERELALAVEQLSIAHEQLRARV